MLVVGSSVVLERACCVIAAGHLHLFTIDGCQHTSHCMTAAANWPAITVCWCACMLPFLTQVTVFLIGAYAKYNWPYVWVSLSCSLCQDTELAQHQQHACCAAKTTCMCVVLVRSINHCAQACICSLAAHVNDCVCVCACVCAAGCMQLRSLNSNRPEDIDAPLDVETTREWKSQGVCAELLLMVVLVTHAPSPSPSLWLLLVAPSPF